MPRDSLIAGMLARILDIVDERVSLRARPFAVIINTYVQDNMPTASAAAPHEQVHDITQDTDEA